MHIFRIDSFDMHTFLGYCKIILVWKHWFKLRWLYT